MDKRCVKVVLCVLVLLGAMVCAPVYAAAVNPDDFEGYTAQTGWDPGPSSTGWQRTGTYYSGDDVAIVAGNGYTGQSMTFFELTGWSAGMAWFWSALMADVPNQVWRLKFRGIEANVDGTCRLGFSPGTVTSWEYPNAIQATASDGTIKLYPGGVDLPNGGVAIDYGNWYTVELEISYAAPNLNLGRARFGPSGGTMNDWTAWSAFNPDGMSGGNPIQPTRLRLYAYGTVDVDDVGGPAVPQPGSLTGQLTLGDFIGDPGAIALHVELLQGGVVKSSYWPNPGTYTISPIYPPGTYDVRFSSHGWLSQTVNGVVVPDGAQGTVPDVTLVNGDLDGDGAVDSTDLSVVLKNLSP